MKKIHSFISAKPETAFFITALFLFAVYLVNLGLLPVFADEPTRAVVAMEMMFSENYWVPTINGEFYYRKPPFYNWIIAGLFHLTGSMSEFVLRLPSVIPLFLFGFTIYIWSKKFIGKHMAFLAAGMYVTCGRMLIYASFIGHIDIFYSWVTFLAFISLIKYGQSGNWTKFFVYSYALSAVAFLCKGLPTVLFQGISIITVLVSLGQFKKFFSREHLLGILIFIIPVGSYFLKYLQFNDLSGWVNQLADQSLQRTPVDKPWYQSVIHIFKFPLDHLYHLAPWSLFSIFMFRSDLKRRIWENPELKLISLIFLANLPVYWLSPGYYPRYLFMLYPLLFIVMAYSYQISNRDDFKRLIFKMFIVFGLIFMVGSLVIFALPNVGSSFSIWQCLIVVLITATSLLLIRGAQTSKWIGIIILLASIRLLFNWVGMPDRLSKGNSGIYKKEALKIAKQTVGSPLKLVKTTSINHDGTFYIERERQEILHHTRGFDTVNYNLIYLPHFKNHPNAVIIDSMLIRHEGRHLYLVKDGN